MENLVLTDSEIQDLAITLKERFLMWDGPGLARLQTIEDTILTTIRKYRREG